MPLFHNTERENSMSQAHTNVGNGIAVLADENTVDGSSTWRVSGVALSEDTTTLGGSGRQRFWPAATLREAADQLEGRHIVKNFHDLQGSANADDVIGQITQSGYQPGVGIVFEGEILDEDIARKVEHEFLDVSSVPGVGSESYDSSRDAYVVEEISGFRDIAVVPDGADQGNEISLGENPAVAALSREALAHPWDALQDTPDPEEDGPTVEDEDGPENSDDTDGADTESSGLRAALRADLELAGSTPDRCKTIKDGAEPIDGETAREMLGISTQDSPTPSGPINLDEDPIAREALSGGRDDSADGPVRKFRPDSSGTMEFGEAEAAQILGTGSETLQESDRTPQVGDAVRWQSDSGGSVTVDGESYRYGVVVDGLQDGDEGELLVAVYEPASDGDGWDNRNEQTPMQEDTLEVVGNDGVGSLPPISQVT